MISRPITTRLLGATATVALLSFAPAAGAQPALTVSDLGVPLGGTISHAYGINESGQVAGKSWLPNNAPPHAVRWDKDGSATDLGVLPGGNFSEGNGINDAGQVVGTSATSAVFGARRAVRWGSDGTITDLGSLTGPSGKSQGYGINNSGQVVGVSRTVDGQDHAALWDGSVVTDLGTLGGSFSQAKSINDKGEVVGQAATAAGPRHAVRWDRDGTATDLGILPGRGDTSIAYGINNRGDIVGTSGGHAVRWDKDGTITDLGTLGGSYSEAFGINNSGRIVGIAATPQNRYHAAFWDKDGSVVDLGTLNGGTGSQAQAINSEGNAVGRGSAGYGGPQHALLWSDAPSSN